MKYTGHYFVLILLAVVLAACNSAPDTEETTIKIDEAVVDVKSIEESLDSAGVDIDQISQTREPAAVPTTAEVEPPPPPKPEWKANSPFYGKGSCADWDGQASTITAECCRYVVANYAGILDNPGKFNIMDLMTKDPFVSACRRYNTDFQDAIDLVENPE